jgi:hypothetical protein
MPHKGDSLLSPDLDQMQHAATDFVQQQETICEAFTPRRRAELWSPLGFKPSSETIVSCGHAARRIRRQRSRGKLPISICTKRFLEFAQPVPKHSVSFVVNAVVWCFSSSAAASSQGKSGTLVHLLIKPSASGLHDPTSTTRLSSPCRFSS